MATVAAEVEVPAPPLAAWELYFDPALWPAWVDQFGAVTHSDGYPRVGGTLRWRSGRAGRGEVVERVLEHIPPSLHRIEFTDPRTEGELAVTLEPVGARTVVRQELDYRLRRRASGEIAEALFVQPFSRVADVLFVRSQMRLSLQRSLAAFAAEVEERSAL